MLSEAEQAAILAADDIATRRARAESNALANTPGAAAEQELRSFTSSERLQKTLHDDAARFLLDVATRNPIDNRKVAFSLVDDDSISAMCRTFPDQSSLIVESLENVTALRVLVAAAAYLGQANRSKFEREARRQRSSITIDEDAVAVALRYYLLRCRQGGSFTIRLKLTDWGRKYAENLIVSARHFILGHELGHHYLRHAQTIPISHQDMLPVSHRHSLELAADQFAIRSLAAGWPIRGRWLPDRGGRHTEIASIIALLTVGLVDDGLSVRPGNAHPPVTRRLASLKHDFRINGQVYCPQLLNAYSRALDLTMPMNGLWREHECFLPSALRSDADWAVAAELDRVMCCSATEALGFLVEIDSRYGTELAVESIEVKADSVLRHWGVDPRLINEICTSTNGISYSGLANRISRCKQFEAISRPDTKMTLSIYLARFIEIRLKGTAHDIAAIGS